jgi:hypothetical protein
VINIKKIRRSWNNLKRIEKKFEKKERCMNFNYVKDQPDKIPRYPYIDRLRLIQIDAAIFIFIFDTQKKLFNENIKSFFLGPSNFKNLQYLIS